MLNDLLYWKSAVLSHDLSTSECFVIVSLAASLLHAGHTSEAPGDGAAAPFRSTILFPEPTD